MKTEYAWIVVSIVLEVYSILTHDLVFIGVNLGFIVFNLFQLRKKKNV